MNTTFYRLLICQIVTLFANAALRFALPLYLLRKTGSAALYGGITAAALVPMLAGTLYGGILADSCRKQTLLAVLNFITALGLLAAAIFFRQIPSTAVVLGTLCLLYAAEGLFQPAVQASLPLLLRGPALTQGNAAVQLADTIDELLGPLLGSLLLQAVGLRTLLIFCAVCLAATALFFQTLPIPQPTRQPPAAPGQRAAVGPLLRHDPQPFGMVGVLALLNLAVVPAITVGVPILVVQYLALPDRALAFTQSAMSAGGLLGGVLAGARQAENADALVHQRRVRSAGGRSAARRAVHRQLWGGNVSGILPDGRRRAVSNRPCQQLASPGASGAGGPLHELCHLRHLPDPPRRAGTVRSCL